MILFINIYTKSISGKKKFILNEAHNKQDNNNILNMIISKNEFMINLRKNHFLMTNHCNAK